MELDAVHVQRAVAQAHDEALVAHGGDGQHVGQALAADDPRVVAAHGQAAGQTVEEVVVGRVGTGEAYFGLHAVEHVGEVTQPCAESLADGLFAQADAQDGFGRGIGTDDGHQQSGFLRNAGTGREQQLVVGCEVGQGETVVAQYGDPCACLFDQLHQVVGERVVVVYNSNVVHVDVSL